MKIIQCANQTIVYDFLLMVCTRWAEKSEIYVHFFTD